MAQTIVVPSGDRLEFPDGMADADIEKAIFAEYPDMAPKKGAMSRIGDAMKPAEREPMPSAADMINAPWTSSFVPQDETINLPGSVMDKFRQPAQKEQAMPIESGMGPMRKDFYDTTRSQIMAAPAQQHEALAVAEGQVGKVAAATLPERQARADRLAAGDMQPRSMQELSDQTDADLRQPRAMFDARQQANREWLQENSKAVAKSIQKNTGLSDEDADAEVERMARAGYKPDWLMDDMPTATLAQAISANTGATWPALQKSLLGLAEFAPNLPVPFVEYSHRTPKQLEMAVSSLDRQIRQARNVGGTIKSGSWNDVVASMGPSLALNLPPLVAGALASTVSPAAGMAIVNGGLGVMGLSAFGDAYLKGQQKGLQSGDNLMQASLSAAAEVIPEKLSLNALFAAFKTLGKGSAIETVKSFLKQQLTEHTTEQITTISHHLIDKAYTEPNKPIDQLWDEMKQTVMATAIQAPLLAGAGTGAYVAGRAGAKAIDNIAASRDLTYGREFDQDQIDAQVRQSLSPDAAQLRRTSPPTPPAAAPSARAELEAILNDKRPVEDILAENQNKAAEAAGWPAVNTPVVAKLIDGQLIRGQIQRIDNGAARFIASDGEVYVFEPGEAEISAASGDGTRAAPVKAVTADDVKLAEQAVDTNPTESQKAAGNYQLGHLNLQGMDIAIENPAGSVRSGVGKDGKPWANTLNHTYGYIKSAEAKDGDKLDAFIGPNPESQAVFVIDQIDPETGRYDEAKAMLGFSSLDEARAAYLSNYDAGWQGLGDITPMHIQAFKAWIAKGDTRKPLAYDEKAAIAARKAEAEQIALLEQINQRFPEPAAPAQTAQSIPSSPQPVPEAAGLQPTGDTNAQAQEAIAAKPRQQEAPAAAVTNPPSTGESPVAQPVGATEKAVIRTKAGKLEVSGFSREDVDGSLTGAKIKAVIAQGQDGKILVSMVGRDGNHMPMPVKQANAVRDALLGKPARPARKRGLTGNLRNDVNIIAPGLYAEVARGGDGEGLAGPTIAGTPTIVMSDKGLQQIAASNQPAAEKARAELEARDQADEVDLGALFDEVLAEETGQADNTATSNRLKLLRYAKNIGVQVMESVGRFHASDGMVEIPYEDSLVDGAQSADHVLAHELGHAAMQNRGISYSGFPAAELRKQISNWDELIVASRNFRPGVWDHSTKRIADHARKPNEIISDAIASVLIGENDFSLLRGLPLTERDIGITGEPKTPAQPRTAGQEIARVEQPQHIEAGQAEPATAPVIAASIKESAKNTPMNIKQAREWLLSEIDKAIIDAKSAKEEGIWNRADDKVNLEGIMDVGATIGFKTFNVPGDGKFRILNLKESLQKFKKQVAATPGFKKNATRPMSVANGSGGKTSVRDMLDDGEYVLAVDYGHLTGKPLLFGAAIGNNAHPVAYTDAEPVDIKGVDAQVGREWNQTGKSFMWRVIETTTGAMISSESTKEKAISKVLAKLDEHGVKKLIDIIKETPKVSQAELERQFTDWGSQEEAVAQKKRDAVERADSEDRALWNSIWPLKDGEKRSPNPWNDIDHLQVAILAKDAAKAGKGDEFVSMIERRRGGTNNVLALAARKALAESSKPGEQSGGVDYKGFERTPTGNGNFTLKDGNLLVKVEAMGGGKFQASHGSAKSSPHINSEQGAVDWAANLRDASKKTTAYPFYSNNKLFNAEGTAELPKDWTGVARSDSGKRFFYLGQENGERSFNPLKAENYEDALKEAEGLKRDKPAVPDGYREVARGYFGGTVEKPIYAPFAEGERVRFIGGLPGNIQSFIGGPVTTGAIIKYDNGLTGRAEWRDVEAIKSPAAAQEPKHFKSIDTLNAANNPLGEDDWIRFADGSEWQVKGRMNGWVLVQGKTEHPTVKNIMGQVPLIRAVIEANDAAQNLKEATTATPKQLEMKARAEAKVTPKQKEMKARAEGKTEDQAGGEAATVKDSLTTESASVPQKPAGFIQSHKDLFERLRDGKATLAEYKDGFASILANKDAVMAELGAMTKDKLLEFAGSRYKNDKKDDVIRGAWWGLTSGFQIGRGLTYSMGENAHDNALRALVEKTTQEDLDTFAERVKAQRDEYSSRMKQMVEAAKDPKTLDDFNDFIRMQKADGLTFAEARMKLTPEQRAEYDRLRGIQSRDQRKARADQQKTDVRVSATTTDGQVIETKHTKTGEPLFVVKAAERVERDVYNHWNATAKRLGGWYSSYRGGGAVPGFQFKTRENADAFLAFIGGNAEQAQEAVQARRDAFEDDRSQSAVERLNEMADRLDERADESLGRERKANTERRARFAASAEAAANAEKAMATTMRRIAAAIEGGTAQFLDRVRQKAQIEYLSAVLRSAKYREVQVTHPQDWDRNQRYNDPPTAETADYAEFPQYTMMRSDLANLARRMVTLPNMKMLGQRILKVADDTSEAYNKFAKEHLLEVSRFGRADGTGFANFSTLKDAERSIEFSKLDAVAVPLQIKRGEYRIVLSPSEAIKRGIWEGDDRKITLDPDIGAEIVEKLGKLNRASKFNRATADRNPEAPWQFENAYNDRKRLAAMGIEEPWEFRAALREFAGLKEAPKERDKIKEMERAMIGRRKDGLDFFPTSAAVVEQMLAAAEIEEGMSVLEPSAGMGHIAEGIREAGVDPDVVELSGDRRELLEAKGFNVVGSDFLDMTPRGFTYGDVFQHKDGRKGVMRGSGGMGSGRVGFAPIDDNGTPDMRNWTWEDRDDLTGIEKRGHASGYDRILMNPPFSDRRDAEHVQHAYTLLRPGGRLVAVVGEGVFFGNDKKAQAFRDWLEEVGATDEKLPEGSFMDPALPVNTGVNARLVVIDKPEGAGAQEFNSIEPRQTKAVDIEERRDGSGYPLPEFETAVPDDLAQKIIVAYNRSAISPETKLGRIEDSEDIGAKTDAFRVMAEAEGYTVGGVRKYLTLSKNNGVVLHARLSDHANVNRGVHFGEAMINIAPGDGRNPIDTFASALFILRNAAVDENGDTVILQPITGTFDSANPSILNDLSTDRNAAITRAIDRAIAMEQGKDVAPLKRQRVRNRLGKLRADLEAGKITEPAFVAEVENLHAQMEIAYQSRQLEPHKGRERGADWIRQKLLEAKRRGDISEEAADFAEWFVLKNPALVEDLGISLRTKQEGQASGNYNPATRVMTLLKGRASDTTAVHEILHHLERMMPAEMQASIRKEWLQQATKELNAAIKAKDQQRIAYFEAVLAGDQKKATEILTGGALDGFNAPISDASRAKRMFHSTSTEAAALKILEDGEIRPPDNKHAMAKLAPVVGRVYVSPSLETASIYSLGGVMMGHDYNWSARTDRAAGRYGYIFEIDPSSYGDVQPDEDSVGELAANAMKDANRNSELRWLADLAQNLGTPNQIRGAKFGEYAAWAQLGKKLVKHMSDAQKTLLIDKHGAHIANLGPLKIARAWKVDKSKAKEIARDGSNVLDVAEQVYGDKFNAVSDRAGYIAKAKTLGLPATGTTESIANLVRIAESDPRTWTESDLKAIAPYLSIHQDVRAGSAGRVASIMQNGLRSGMVDALDGMVSGRNWTWAGGLKGGDAYVFLSGTLKYRGKGNPALAEGNMPLFHIKTEAGQSVLDSLQTATAGDGLHLDLDIGRDYRYLNPSEFWAVSMTETVADRFKAKDSIWSRSLQWLREALEHIKAVLGLNSTHPMIKALDAISNGDGEFVSKDMLSDAKLYASIEPISPVIEEVVGPVLRDASLPARLLLHPRQMAANHKEFAPVFDTAIRQYEERDSIVSKLGDFAKPYFDLSHAKKRRVGQIIEQGRLDRMTYTEADLENGIHHHGGDLVRLDAEEKAAYIALRKSFTHALTLFRNTMLEEYGFPELVNEERAAIRLAQMIAAGEIEESRLEWAKKVAVAIHEIEQANRTGYVPFTRYGQFVVAVKALPNGVDVVEDDDLVLVRGVPESADEGTADAKLVNIVADLMGQFDPERNAWIVPVSRNQAVRALENTLYATKVEVGSIKEWRSRGKDVTEIPEVKAVYEAAKARYGNVQNSRIIAFHVAEKEKARDANITAMDELAKIASVDTETWDEVRAKLQDAIKSRGFRRHFFGSDNTPGYSTDFERSIADYIIGMSGYLARRKHVKEFDDAIKRIKAPRLAAYADEYRQYVNSPADEFALVKQIGFLSYIAGTVATAFTNLTQVPMLTVPTLTQFVPNHIAVRETARAWKDAQAMFSPTKTGLQMFDPAKVPEDVREAFMAAWNDQLFVPLETLDLMATASVKTVGGRTTMRVLNTTTQAIAYQFMFAERLNRITTFVAAARISRMPVARQNAARVTAGDAWAKFSIGGRKWNERAFAEWAIDESQYRMGKVNRPKISRGVGSPLLQFKGYMMQTLEAGYRMAAMHGPRGQVSFLAALAMMLMLGGLWGLPGLEDLRDIIEKFYKLTTGKDLDMKTEVRRIVAETTGSATVGSAAAKGIPYATVGVDMSRVGMGNIIPDSPLQMLGIPADLAVGRPQRAAEKALAGNYYGAASELLPNFLKNPAVGFQWKFDGVRDRYGSRLMTPGEFDYADVAVKSLGWTPTKVTNRRDYAYAESRAESGINELKRRYTNDLVRAYVREQAAATDAERRQYQGEQKAVLDAIAKHNAKAGQEQIIKLDPDTLRKKVAAETLGGKAREGKERKLSRDAAQQRRELFQLP